jgi:hypothetical protein
MSTPAPAMGRGYLGSHHEITSGTAYLKLVTMIINDAEEVSNYKLTLQVGTDAVGVFTMDFIIGSTTLEIVCLLTGRDELFLKHVLKKVVFISRELDKIKKAITFALGSGCVQSIKLTNGDEVQLVTPEEPFEKI